MIFEKKGTRLVPTSKKGEQVDYKSVAMSTHIVPGTRKTHTEDDSGVIKIVKNSTANKRPNKSRAVLSGSCFISYSRFHLHHHRPAALCVCRQLVLYVSSAKKVLIKSNLKKCM